MNKTVAFLITSFTFVFFHLQADLEQGDISYHSGIRGADPRPDMGPLSFDVEGDYVTQAQVRDHPHIHHLNFYTAEAVLGTVYYYNPCYKEGADISISYVRTRMDLQHNPYFHQKNFNQLSLNFGVSTERLEGWIWKSQISINFDADHWDLEDYTNYDFLAWGRYQYCQNLGVHIGFLGYTGMKIDRVYPIVGFDWRCNEKWKFNLVFPVDISAVYHFRPSWYLAVAGRGFDLRYRVGKHEPLSMALWSYRAVGVELSLTYKPYSWFTANVHVGEMLGGRVKIANRHYRHHRYFDFDASPYLGGQVEIHY